MSISILEYNECAVNNIAKEILMDNNKLKLLPAEHYKKYKQEDFRCFCNKYARYGIPTIELVEYLNNIINGRDAIEVGAGHGDLGHYLQIPMTDNKQQEHPYIKKIYDEMRQPVIKYPDDVEKIEALKAIKKYKPKVVIGSWITTYSPHHSVKYGSSPFGFKESAMLKLIDTFIIIGNMNIHGDKPIRMNDHILVIEPWIISRASDETKNCIFVWSKK
jgi:hypothetical protein